MIKDQLVRIAGYGEANPPKINPTPESHAFNDVMYVIGYCALLVKHLLIYAYLSLLHPRGWACCYNLFFQWLLDKMFLNYNSTDDVVIECAFMVLQYLRLRKTLT
jgi:hypothetical protein